MHNLFYVRQLLQFIPPKILSLNWTTPTLAKIKVMEVSCGWLQVLKVFYYTKLERVICSFACEGQPSRAAVCFAGSRSRRSYVAAVQIYEFAEKNRVIKKSAYFKEEEPVTAAPLHL